MSSCKSIKPCDYISFAAHANENLFHSLRGANPSDCIKMLCNMLLNVFHVLFYADIPKTTQAY